MEKSIEPVSRYGITADAMTYAQAQAATGINHKWLRRMAAARVLRTIKLGHRTVLIRRAELDRVIALFESKPTVARSQMKQ